MPSSNSHRHPPQGYEEREEVISAFFRGETSKETAVEKLVALAATTQTSPEILPATFIIIAYDYADDLEKLAELLIAIVELPKVTDADGNEIDQVDLHELGWDFNSEWNALDIPKENPGRQEVISQFLNINKLCAELIRTQHPAFAYLDLFALWTFRGALEKKATQDDFDPPEAFIPAACALISTAGKQIYGWNKEFEYGGIHGDPGGGGELWDGWHGFCKERWMFWKRRFQELSGVEELPAGLRLTAGEAAKKMAKVEDQTD